MSNYENIKHKINKLWLINQDNDNIVNSLKKGLVKNISFNYDKKISKYIVYEGAINNEEPIIFKIELNEFPENILINLKPILISEFESVEINSYNIENVMYIFYQGISVDIKLSLINMIHKENI